MTSYYKKYLNVIDTALAKLEITSGDGSPVGQDQGFDTLCELAAQIRETKNVQYLVGNGASAAFANHMALDWTKNGKVMSHSFSDSALLTAMGNDLGYEEVFAVPLSQHAKRGDLLVAISSSGNSPNIVRAIEVAREAGMRVVTLSGLMPDNASRRLGDVNLYIPAKTYGVVECSHQVLLHVWLDKFMGITEWDRVGFQNMRNDKFSL